MTQKLSNFSEVLQERAICSPDRVAFSYVLDSDFRRSDLTYQELDDRSRAIAYSLQKAGLVGERALLLYSPGLEFITAFFGCLYAGVVAVPVYPPRLNQSLNRLQAIINDAQANAVLTTESVLTSVRDHHTELSGIQWITTDNPDLSLSEQWRRVDIVAKDIAFLQYTSGSTGSPKGVMVSHENLLHNSAAIHNSFQLSTESRAVSWLPPYHDMGLIGGILQPVYSGLPMTLLSPVTFLSQPSLWLEAISRCRANVSGGPSFAYDLVCHRITPAQKEQLDLSSWEVAFVGAEPIRAEVLDRFVESFADCGFRRSAFYPCYGLAESTLFVTGGLKDSLPNIKRFESTALSHDRVLPATATELDARTLVSCGRAGLGGRVEIVNPETLTLCRDHEVGEIWVAGASVAQGYWQKIAETQRDFQAYASDTGAGPFLRTGDLGFLHHGELFVTGRLKDLIIMRGRNYYSQDIEQTVEKCHPCLRSHSIAAFAFEAGNAEYLAIAAEVERTYLRKLTGQKVSTSNSSTLQISTVFDAIRRAVLKEHEISVAAVLLLKTGSIPKTSSGKIQRYACREGYLQKTLNLVGAWEAGEFDSDLPHPPAEDFSPPARTPEIDRLSHVELKNLLAAEIAAVRNRRN